MSEPEEEKVEEYIELGDLEIECIKTNFRFYDKAQIGFVERFELPMILEGKSLNQHIL